MTNSLLVISLLIIMASSATATDYVRTAGVNCGTGSDQTIYAGDSIKCCSNELVKGYDFILTTTNTFAYSSKVWTSQSSSFWLTGSDCDVHASGQACSGDACHAAGSFSNDCMADTCCYTSTTNIGYFCMVVKCDGNTDCVFDSWILSFDSLSSSPPPPPPPPSPPPPSPPPPPPPPYVGFNMSWGDMYALSGIYGDGCPTFSACDKDCMAAYDVRSTDFTGSSGYLTLEAAVNPNPNSCTCDTKYYQGAITHASSSGGSDELLDTNTDAGMNVRFEIYGDYVYVQSWPNTYSYYSSSHGCELSYSKTDPYWYNFNMNTGDELTFSYKSETCPLTSWCETSCAQGYTVSVLTSTDYKFTSSYAGTDCVCDVLYFSGKSTGRGIYVGSGLELYMAYSDIILHSPHDDCSISYYQNYAIGASSKLKMLRVTFGIISALAFLI